MSVKKISIATDFSETPGGRAALDGPYSGERFRDEVLLPALQNFDQVEVDLDGTLGYGSSFLEEAFGGLIRVHGLRLPDLKTKLLINSTRLLYFQKVWKYLEDAERVRSSRAGDG